MKYRYLMLTFLLFNINMNAQENNNSLPYHELPEASTSYTGGTVAARMVDGLGFRYYWASEGLRSADLSYKPSAEARTTEETIDHILGLSTVILNSALHKVNEGNDFSELSFTEKRE